MRWVIPLIGLILASALWLVFSDDSPFEARNDDRPAPDHCQLWSSKYLRDRYCAKVKVHDDAYLHFCGLPWDECPESEKELWEAQRKLKR